MQMEETIFTYVESERARGISDEDIRTELLEKGWPQDAVEIALVGDKFTFKKFFTQGKQVSRVGRKQYLAIIFMLFASISASIFFISMTFAFYDDPTSYFFAQLIAALLAIGNVLLFVLLLVRSIRATVWRFHDIGMGTVEAVFLVLLIPLFFIMPALVIMIIVPYLIFREGSKGANSYGPPPSANESLWTIFRGIHRL